MHLIYIKPKDVYNVIFTILMHIHTALFKTVSRMVLYMAFVKFWKEDDYLFYNVLNKI